MKNIVLFILLLQFVSCDIMKQSTKSKGEISQKETIENTVRRKGDTVSFIVPKLEYRTTWKDTTIYTVNRQGTTLRTVYDKQGEVSSIDCFASAIEEITKQNREFLHEYKDKSKEKKEEFDSSFILYIVGGFVILGIIALILLFIIINKNTKAIIQIAQHIK